MELSLDRYHFDFLVILKETLTFLSLSNPVLQHPGLYSIPDCTASQTVQHPRLYSIPDCTASWTVQHPGLLHPKVTDLYNTKAVRKITKSNPVSDPVGGPVSGPVGDPVGRPVSR